MCPEGREWPDECVSCFLDRNKLVVFAHCNQKSLLFLRIRENMIVIENCLHESQEIGQGNTIERLKKE